MHHSIQSLLAAEQSAGSTVTIKGWIRTRRDSKAGFSFLQIHDGSCHACMQIVAPNTLDNYANEILHMTTGCSVSVTGQLVESPAQGQAFELQANKVELIGGVEDPDTYPMAPKKHSMEHLREHAHLRPRTNTIGSMTRIRHTMAQAIHRYLDQHGFFWISTPIITSVDCEGAGELFRVTTLDLMNPPKTEQNKINYKEDFFGTETYLAVSGQLNVESYCESMSKVYTFGPTFRAENSNTSRHLAEFWMLEPEVAFADLNDIIHLAEKLIKFVFKTLLEERSDDLDFFDKHIDNKCLHRIHEILEKPFTQITYTEAVERLLKSHQTFEFPVEWGCDLQTEHERFLAETLIGGPVAVTDYPKDIKAFYMRMNDDNKTVSAADILVPGMGEIIGGSAREERYDFLLKRMQAMQLNINDYQWYLDLRRYGTVPHAGFGLGFERFVSYVTGLQNVRDVIAFPRVPKQVAF